MKNEKLLKQAKKHVKRKKDFFTHTMVMVAISAFLGLIAFVSNSTDVSWLLICIGAMFLSVAFHYIGAFGIGGLGKGLDDWEADELEDEYLRLKELDDRKKLLLDKDSLKLKQLEKKIRNDKFV